MSESQLPTRRASIGLLALWLLSGAVLMLFLGRPEVSRTQEARVLETAREMLGQDWHSWIVPHLNGKLRLEKPPLPYWMAAGSFKLFGVSEAVGRAPFALLAWLTLGLVYRIGREWF